MITRVSSNLTFLMDESKVCPDSSNSFLTSLLMSFGIRFSSTIFSTSAMDITRSGCIVASGLKLESDPLSSEPSNLFDLTLCLSFLAFLSNSWFLVELWVATL